MAAGTDAETDADAGTNADAHLDVAAGTVRQNPASQEQLVNKHAYDAISILICAASTGACGCNLILSVKTLASLRD